MRRFFVFLTIIAIFYATAMVLFPLFFLRHIENKYEISLKGKRNFSLIQPKITVKGAAFIWKQKVELIEGDFVVEVDPRVWIRSQVWSVRASGDGARLRFLGDWLKKTGINEVHATRLRLALQFSDEGIYDIDTVDLVSSNYQFQIQSRMAKKA